MCLKNIYTIKNVSLLSAIFLIEGSSFLKKLVIKLSTISLLFFNINASKMSTTKHLGIMLICIQRIKILGGVFSSIPIKDKFLFVHFTYFTFFTFTSHVSFL